MKSLISYLSFVLCFPLALSAENVVIEDSQGESYVLEVQQEDSFLDLIDYISSSRWSDTTKENVEENRTFKVTISKHASPMEKFSKKLRANPRSYEDGITVEESADIAYILKTMANSSLPRIKVAESSLNKAGDRIDHVHPFYFLSCIFTNEELKVCIRNLQGRTWVWKGFLDGITSSLEEENGRNNLLQFTSDFAAKIKVNSDIIFPIIQAGRWERLIDTLIDVVPREGGTDRYNM